MANIQPNKVYKIIGASNPNSPNIGKRCKTLFKFTDRPPHSLWGMIWRVAAVDGTTFIDGHGEENYEVNVAEDWLEIDTDSPDALLRETEKEIENGS